MDAVEFLTEKRRMCESNKSYHCGNCELQKEHCCYTHKTKEDAEKAVAIVEQWSKENQKKTRASEFLKVYPDTVLSVRDGYPSINPCMLDRVLFKKARCDKGCPECRKQYWTEEIK